MGIDPQDCAMGSKDTLSGSGYIHYWLCELSGFLHSAAYHAIYLGTLAAKPLVIGAVMNGGSQNPLSQQWSLTPGRVIRKVKRHTMPSGKKVELQWISTTIRDSQGVWHTEETIQVVPPPDDGSVVTEANYEKLNECTRCLSVTVEPFRCPKCSKIYDLPCTEEIKVKEKDKKEEKKENEQNDGKKEKDIRYCVDCAKELKTPKFLKVLRNTIWGKKQ